MKRHLNYLKYIIRHKWFVFLAARKVKCSLWLAIIHDLSKFRPSEWGPYARTFYKPCGGKQYVESDEFATAWNHHQKRNKHHYQYWVILWDRGDYQPIQMPLKYIKEMVADWAGAGKAITGKWEVKEWYNKNSESIKLHHISREYVEAILRTKF